MCTLISVVKCSRLHDKKTTKCNSKNTFHIFNQNIWFWYSKESSQWEDSFEHPKQMLNLMSKKFFHNFKPNIFSSPEPKAHG